MKKRMSKLLTSIFSVLLVATVAVGFIPTASAEESSPEIYTEGLWSYYVQNGEAITTFFNDASAGGDVEVPATLGGYPVTTIGTLTFSNSFFSWNKEISSITVSNNVRTVEEHAFSNCLALDYVKFGDGVTTIGTIDGCSINTVFIGNNITNPPVFSYCFIENIVVSDNNKRLSSSDGVLFNKEKTKLIRYPVDNSRKSYIIPDSVSTIGAHAFDYHTGYNLETLIIPTSVKVIEGYVFFDNTPDIYYAGSKEDWNKISISQDNEHLFNYINIFYDYEIPSTDNNDTDEDEKSFWDQVVSIFMTVVDFIKSVFNTILSWFK